MAVEPHQARAAIDMVLPWLDRLAAAGDHENLRAFGSCLRELSPRGDASSGQRIVEAVRPPAARALAAGRGQTLASLLGSCGPERENVLLDQFRALLCEQNATWTAAAEPVDRQVLSELLLEALAAAGAQPDRAPPKSQLLIAAFRAAKEASRTAEVYALLADTEIKAQLGRKWDAQQQQLASTLETHVPPAACPEASAWLNMELARTAQQGDEVLRRLTRLAAAHARLPENARKTKQLFKLTGDLLTDPLHRAVAFGRMAEAAAGSALGERFFDDFQDAVEPLKPEQCDKAHRGLARAGAVNVLCRAIVADVLPWDQESHKRFQRWSKVVLESSPAVVDCLCSRLVDLLDQEDRAEQVFPVARQLMAKPAASGDAAAMRRLYDKVLLTMPLEPLSEKWNRVFSMLPEGLDAVARNRLQVFRFMREVQTLAGQPDWSIARFPDDKPAWRELDRLPPPEPWQVVTWCVDRLKGLQNAGIETSNDARTFVEKFRAAKMESPQHLAAAVVRLTGDCDPVSRVLVATTFACCGLEGAAGFRGWRDLVVAIADRLDPATRDLFELHLRYRFRRPDPELRNRLHNLYVALGMEQPERPAEAAAPPPDAGQADHPTEGIVRSVLHFFRGKPSDK